MADDFSTKSPFVLTRIESYYDFIKSVMRGNYKNLPIDRSVDEIDNTYVEPESDETDDSDSGADNARDSYYHGDQASSSQGSRKKKFSLVDTIFRFTSCVKPHH